ncbi:hypothetical protein [Aliikangiella maris]|uniref:Uncharacterized protein n=2 Tax=Aliikangiella maris TaxID=3162458 RepID=A0ABV2BZG7_9GAMM
MSNSKKIPTDLDDYLFGNGLTIENYFVRVTPFSETICYRNGEGKEFYLTVNNDEFEEKLRSRLIELGSEIVRVGEK